MPIDLRQQSAKLYGNRYPSQAKPLGGRRPDLQATGQPPFTPLQRATVGEPTAAGQYISHLRQSSGGSGLLTNDLASAFYSQNADPITGQRYMPRTTVGGAWGQRPSNFGQLQQAEAAPGEYASPRLGQADIMRGTDPVRDSLVSQATTATLLENPDGRWFQGAAINPNANQYPGASTFIEPNRSTRTPEQAAGRFAMAANRAVARNPALSVSSTGALVGSPNPDFAPPTAEQLAENRANYQARRGVDLAARRQGVVQNAQARATARRDRMDGPSIDEALAMRDPRYGIALANLRAQQGSADADRQNALAVQQARNEGALGVAQAEAGTRQQEQALAYRAQRLGEGASEEEVNRELASSGMTPQRPGSVDLSQPPGRQAPQANAVASGRMTSSQWKDMMALDPGEWEQYLRGLGITDRYEASGIIKEASGNPQSDIYAPEGRGLGSAFQDMLTGTGPASRRLRDEGYTTGVPFLTPATMLYNQFRYGNAFGPNAGNKPPSQPAGPLTPPPAPARLPPARSRQVT